MKLLTRSVESLIKHKAQGKYCTTPAYIYPSKDEEYSSVPKYPAVSAVHPDSEEGIKRRWFDKIKRQSTVEEKLFEVNVQRRWGWKCFMVHEGVVPLNNLTFAQHMTRTHLIEIENFPDYYNQFSEKCKALLGQVKNDVIDAIEYQLDIRRHKLSEMSDPLEKEKEMTRFIITELNRTIMNRLWVKQPHLKSLQIDYSPRIEASWKIESLMETYVPKREDHQIPDEEIPEEYLDRPSDKYIQYLGHPILQLRASEPLPQFIQVSEANILHYSVPIYRYDPHLVLGYQLDRRFLNNIPGFWPGDDREFSFLSYHFSNHIKHRPSAYGAEDAKEALQSQALFASFGWLMSLACYQGFSSYQDVTYPMTTQTVLTDGKEFTFALYQLNTTELHWENPMENLKCNLCWMTSSNPLYQVVENGRLKGFNEEVLEKLIQFYINVPKTVENVKLKPYLGEKVKHVADYEDNEKVEWLQEKFKHCSANKRSFRSTAERVYEVKDWERIYKIMFPMRPLDARRRPFELKQNPYLEKLSDAPGEYIPKHLRPDKHLQKWKQLVDGEEANENGLEKDDQVNALEDTNESINYILDI